MNRGKYRGQFCVTLLLGVAISASTWGQSAVMATQAGDPSEVALKKDPAWKPNHHETRTLTVGQAGSVNNYCLNTNGNLLVCVGGDKSVATYDANTKRTVMKTERSQGAIAVFTPGGKKVATWNVPIKPGAICALPDGTILVGGDGRVLKLSQSGQILAKGTLPSQNLANANKEMREVLASMGREVTGIAATSTDVFVATLSPSDYSYVVYRLSRDLKTPKLIVSSLSGCCGQMDIQAHDGELWVAHNARHLVERYDRSGKKLFGFGKFDRKAASGFGGCCEPKNLRFVGNYIYAAESGPPTVVKKFSLKGKFLGVVALPDFKTGCVRVTTEVSKDGAPLFILDPDAGLIHVMEANK